MFVTLSLLLSILFALIRSVLSLPLLLLPSSLSSFLFSSLFSRFPSFPLFFSSHFPNVFPHLPKFKSPSLHQQQVRAAAEKVKKAARSGKKIVMGRKPGAGHSSRSADYKKGSHRIDLSCFDSILCIDISARTVIVESYVTFEQLCRATLRFGLLPCVVPELKSITVGGAIQGIGIESSSWREGTVDESVIEAELITGKGEVRKSNESDEMLELWNAIPGSNGSLALIVSAKLRLVSATSWTKVRYEFYPSLSAFLTDIAERNYDNTEADGEPGSWIGENRLIDGIRFNGLPKGTKVRGEKANDGDKESGIVAMVGGCVIEPTKGDTIYRDSPFQPFFFQHVESILASSSPSLSSTIGKKSVTLHEELMPTLDYVFRYDRGGYWGIMVLVHILPFLKFLIGSPFRLAIFNHFMSTSTLYKIAMLVSDTEREKVGLLQDVDIPLDKAEKIVNWADEHGLDKLWLCPVKQNESDLSQGLFKIAAPTVFSKPSGPLGFNNLSDNRFVINIGLYGCASGLPHSTLELQRLVGAVGGKLGLYAHVYLAREEFWSWYDKKKYDRLRKKWAGEAFMGLWEKVAMMSRTVSSNST